MITRDPGPESGTSGPQPADSTAVPSSGRPGRITALALLAALGASFYAAWIWRDVSDFGRLDDGVYSVTAQSLAAGHGYRIASLPGEPYQTKYPPVYPLILSLAWRLWPSFPANLPIIALVNWLFLPLFVLCAYLATAEFRLTQRQRQWVAIACAVSPTATLLSNHLLADLPSLCFIFLSLVLARRASMGGTVGPAALAGAAACCAFLTKSAALPLLIAVPLGFLLKRQGRPAAAFGLVSLPGVIAWTLWARAHASREFLYYTDYLGYYFNDLRFSDLPGIVRENAFHLVASSGGLAIANLLQTQAAQFLCIVLGLLLIAAAVRLALKTGLTFHGLFLGGYALELLFWNFPPNERLLLPALPFLLSGAFSEATRIWGQTVDRTRGLSKTTQRTLARFVLILLAAASLAVCIQAVRLAPTFASFHRHLRAERQQAFEWLRGNAPPDARVVTWYDAELYLTTGLRASLLDIPVMRYYRRDQRAALAAFRGLTADAGTRGFDYLVITPGDLWMEDVGVDERQAILELLRTSSAFRVSYRSPGTVVFRIQRSQGGS